MPLNWDALAAVSYTHLIDTIRPSCSLLRHPPDQRRTIIIHYQPVSYTHLVGLEYDPTNYLLMHAMGPNVAGVIGSAVAAGILLGFLM